MWASAQPVFAYLSSLAFDPYDRNTAYATYSTFGVTHVFKSTDAGATWNPFATGLPDIPAHSIIVDPTDTSRLYAGTDLGVFVWTGGPSWAVENTGYANVITEHLVVNGANLYAFTHGRGAWRVSLRSTQTAVVRMESATTIATEGPGTTADVAVTLQTSDHANLGSSVTVAYATADGSAVAGADYQGTTGTLTFGAGAANGATQTISVPLLDDSLVDPNETFTVSLTGGTALLGTERETLVTIKDNASLQFKLALLNVSETATKATLAVTRTEDKTSAVSVAYATSDGTATMGNDYSTTAGTLNFAPNATSQTFAVTLLPDTTFEGNEQLLLRLSSPGGGAALGSPRTMVLGITENDGAAILQFSASKYTVSEAGPTAKVLVKRSGITTSNVTVDYTITDGTASYGADYDGATSGTLAFAAGVITQTLEIPTVENATAETPETVKVALSSPLPSADAKLGTLAAATLTINDNDQSVQFSAPSYTVSEGTAKAVLTVKRGGGTSGLVNVDWAVSGGTATQGLDYGTPTSGQLTFTPGSVSKTLAIPLINDTDGEGDENIEVTLSNPAGATILGTNPVLASIIDNEPTVLFSASKYSASETATKASITVKRTGGTTTTLNATYSVSPGTATYGEDYTGATSGTLTFSPGQATRTFSVILNPDTKDEPNETINLALTSAEIPLGTPKAAVLTVTDNDTAGKIQLSATTYSVDEEAGTATITLTRASGTASAASVGYTLGTGPAGTTSATAGVDYTATPGTVTFGLGELKKTFTIPIASDLLSEGNETLTITLGSPSYGAVLGTQKTAVLWIVDDE
ncbi:MAG: hypothetical protein HY317_02815 [Acidobacteria bacterium]|nr:hypothetical protein [Acidobacteriota bacterium]